MQHTSIIDSVLANNQSVPVFVHIVDMGFQPKNRRFKFSTNWREAGRILGDPNSSCVRERDIDAYAVYWGSAEDVVIRSEGSLVVVPKPGFGSFWRNQPTLDRTWLFCRIDKGFPDATHLLVFTRNEEGQMSGGVLQAGNRGRGTTARSFQKWEPTESEGFIMRNRRNGKAGRWIGFHPLPAGLRRIRNQNGSMPILTQYEIRGIRDGIVEKDLRSKPWGWWTETEHHGFRGWRS